MEISATDGRELVIADGITTEGTTGVAFVEECDIFVNAGGAYNNWRWPTTPNREAYKGNMMHSAVWPNVDRVSGRTVTLIGNGSSGIQILPTILPKVDKVFVVLRSRTWVTPALANRFAGENGANKIFSDEEKKDWSETPARYLAYRKEIENELNVRFRLYLRNSQAQKMGRDATTKQMSNRLSAKPELIDDLIPEFSVG